MCLVKRRLDELVETHRTERDPQLPRTTRGCEIENMLARHGCSAGWRQQIRAQMSERRRGVRLNVRRHARFG